MGKPITLQIKGNGGISLGMSPKGTTNYPSLTNKPSINDVELVDNKTSDDLHLQNKLIAGDTIELIDNGDNTTTINGMGGGGNSDYELLTNHPQINSIVLMGDKSSSDLGLQDEMVPITEQDIDEIMYGG